MLWERTPPVRVRRNIPTSWLELCITEGRNRQVRRMTAAVGLPCQRLIRMAIGPYDLEGLAPGTFGWVARHCVIGVRSFIDVSLCFRSMNLNFMDGRPFDSLSRYSDAHDETVRRDAPEPCAINVSTKALSDTPSDLARMVNWACTVSGTRTTNLPDAKPPLPGCGTGNLLTFKTAMVACRASAPLAIALPTVSPSETQSAKSG